MSAQSVEWVGPERMAKLSLRELARFEEQNQRSRALGERARKVLAGGVASGFQVAEPWPVQVADAHGALLTDVDGNRRLDFNNAYGAGIQGHGNPAIAAGLGARYAAGSQFGAPSEEGVLVAEQLVARWQLPLWRFTTSGREAALDAIRIARGAAGRETIVRMGGGYHGVGVAQGRSVEEVPFNDPDALERTLDRLAGEGRPAAAVILEPAFALGTLLPAPGYLGEVRSLTEARGVLLIVDEAKTGLTLASGGATERFGLEPDLVILAKALGGGLSAAAVGGTERAMRPIATGELLQAGTFNGNALSMCAARICLAEVLTEMAYRRFDRQAERLARGLNVALAAAPLPACGFAIAARGAVVAAPRPPRNHEEHLAAARPELERLFWLYAVNRGVYLAPARPFSWTLSVAHEDEHVERFIELFREFFDELA